MRLNQINEDKKSINAPCVYYEIDEKKHRMSQMYPSVNCNHICETCGWNPQEKERRLKTGKFCSKLYRKNAETDEIVELPDGTKSLYFKRVLPNTIG